MSYAHPGKAKGDRYFKLPFGYWDHDEPWCSVLSLPGKAMLLISLSLQPGFALPAERAPAWYGFSADTAQRGLAQLMKHGLLTRKWHRRKAPLIAAGYTYRAEYTLEKRLLEFTPLNVPSDSGATSAVRTSREDKSSP